MYQPDLVPDLVPERAELPLPLRLHADDLAL